MEGKVKFAGATKGMAINNATTHVNKLISDNDVDVNPNKWARMVCDHAEALLTEIDKREMLK